MHHDPLVWSNPQRFDPSRFDLSDDEQRNELCKKVYAFSAGKRSCPAQNGFAEVVFKVIVTESLSYHFNLDQQIETIPTNSLEAYWHQEYYAKVDRVVPEAAQRTRLACC